MAERTQSPSPEQERGPRPVYENDAVEVVWEPKFCIHVQNCVRRLGQVFDASKRPWIDVDAAEFIRGRFRVVDEDGRVIREDTRLALCRCGASANKPFCDG